VNDLTYYSPAKVNLFFKVLNKRSDGYHDIASLYQTVNLFDIISIKKSKKDSFTCLSKIIDLKWDDGNLIKKALLLFREKTRINHSVEIILNKNIPIEAGLGGGSSNAATMLFALNELFDNPLNVSELKSISSKIGADVAFFFSSGKAFCRGIGDVFEEIKPEGRIDFYIAKPSFGMSTKKVYQNVKLGLLIKQDSNNLRELVYNNKISYFNDLEVSAFELEPRLSEVKNQLMKMGFDRVVMTGSGSSFLCFGEVPIIENKEINFYKVFNIQRNPKNWYSLA
jgi:4-diphosphocytidyl-2-C-methyl-D-erythritol kinase